MPQPYDIAKELYSDGGLDEIVAFCMEHGHVHSDGNYFICMYPTCRSLIENKDKKNIDKPDTWYVYVATGDVKRVFEHVKPLKFVAFRRFDEKFRIIKFEKIRSLLWATLTR